jgi:glycerophosphoryl diester phosphodiesterase
VLSASPILYAHRGASLELPENTLEAFRLALDLGAHAIETDAHMTRDGRIVLSHDPTGDRLAGVRRAIRDCTLEEIRSWDVGRRFFGTDGVRVLWDRPFRVPTLDEVLEAFPDVAFNVDAKQVEPDMVPALVRCIRAARAEDRVRIASFSAKNLERARALGYPHTGLAAMELAPLMLAPLAIAKRMHVGGEAAQVPRRAWGVRLASRWAIDRLHALGVRVDFWTVDDPDEARRLLAMGADGIMTDDPRRVAPAFA